MTFLDALFGLHYAQWMMLAGGVLLAAGFIAYTFNQNRSLRLTAAMIPRLKGV
jgi:hypothetical protein